MFTDIYSNLEVNAYILTCIVGWISAKIVLEFAKNNLKINLDRIFVIELF